MGCCGISVYPRNQEIDMAESRMHLMMALKNLIKSYEDEVKDIQEHLAKGTAIKNEQIAGLDDPSLKKRAGYLGELMDCYQRAIGTLNKCTDSIPLKQTKDLLQNIIGHYYCAYDQTKRYLNDETAFNNLKKSSLFIHLTNLLLDIWKI